MTGFDSKRQAAKAKQEAEPVAQSDLVKRLRDTASKGVSVWGDLQMEAAREIEILAAERECYASAMDRMQEPTPWRDMVVVSLVREGINKHRARELADHFATPLAAAQPEQEPVGMRMPKVGDRVICLEDESLGTVVSLTAGGSPDITFDDGSRGTYLLREFAELFGYVAPPQRPVAYDKTDLNRFVQDLYDEKMQEGKHGHYEALFYCVHQAIKKVAPPKQQAEPVISAWSLREVYFDEDGEPLMHRSPPAAQRPWVGLTDEEILEACQLAERGNYLVAFQRIQIKLKERNT
jgi:hypothetical protein